MTLCRATVVLAIGWVLVLPSLDEHGSRAPVARWQHAGSFDSQNECEAVRAELIEAARRPLGDPWMVPDVRDAAQVEQKISLADSRCLPRSDPRIAPLD